MGICFKESNDVTSGRNVRVAQLVRGFEEQMAAFVQSNPLHNAVKCGNIIKIRRLLVTERYPVDDLDVMGNTPLLASFTNSSTNRLDVVQTLINFGANVNAKTRDGCLTPLQLCCSTKPPDFLQVTEYLISVGADVSVKGSSFKRNLIHMASLRLNAVEYHHYLSLIIEKGHSGLISEVDTEGNTPLHMATRLELHRDTLQLFKDHGTNFNALNFERKTVLDESVINKRTDDFLKCLSMFGALSATSIPPAPLFLSPVDVEWWTLKFCEVVERIGENLNDAMTEIEQLNNDWKSRNKQGNTLLHAAVMCQNFQLAKLLLAIGFDANAVGNDGSTPLLLCVDNYSESALETIKVLLEHGADVEMDKQSCFELCTRKKVADWMSLFHCLLQHTKDIDGALKVARNSLPEVEFIELEKYLKNNRVDQKEGPPSPPKVALIKVIPPNIDWKAEFCNVITKIENNPKLIKVLVDELNSKWVRNCTTGNSLLHAAAYYRNSYLAKILLAMGYDANSVGNHGYTPLQSCYENNSENALEITQMLLEHRASVDLKPIFKHSSFHLLTVRKPPDWIPVFSSLLQLSGDPVGALDVASNNLSPEELTALQAHLQQKGDTSNETSRHTSDDGVLELALQLEETKGISRLDTMVGVMLSVREATGDNNVSHELLNELNQSERFQCSDNRCQKRFETSLKLQLHMIQKHNGERIFTCHVCSHKIKTAQGYEIHLRTHTQEKPFLCHQCGKRFMAHNGLRKHLPSHSGARPFVCTHCQKTFALNSILKEHIKTHTEVSTPFGCSSCEKRFRFKKGLTRHQRMHFEHEKYCCQACNRMFDRKDNLNRHYNRLHSSA